MKKQPLRKKYKTPVPAFGRARGEKGQFRVERRQSCRRFRVISYGLSSEVLRAAVALYLFTPAVLFTGFCSVPAPATQPPGQAMPSSR